MYEKGGLVLVEFKLAEKEDIKKIASFIAKINSKEESHIGYCGTNSQEIASSLMEDITDIPLNESFIIGIEDGTIIGILGFDTDLESNNAEIWGSFLKEGKWDTLAEMWSRMIEILPKEIDLISMFINKKNENCLRLADNFDFPVLLIVGEKNTTGNVIKYNEMWAGNDNYPLKYIKNAAHNSNVDNPKEFNKILESFLLKL